MQEDSSIVRVRYHKFDGSPHRSYPAVRLGSDEYGDWLGVPSGEFIAAALADFKYTDPYVLLVPRDAWWTAMFNSPPRRTEVYCDITTPAVWIDDGVVLTDLDLDVRRRREHNVVELLDEDEFDDHRVRYGYPSDVIAAAWDAAEWLLKALDDGTEPFGSEFRRWLDKVI